MTKVLAIHGSPRMGTTGTLLNHSLLGARGAGGDVLEVSLRDLEYSPCTECGGCYESGICVIEDDMQKMYRELMGTDVMLLASPVFFLGPPAILKAFIDRCQSIWIQRERLGKAPESIRPSYLILAGGGRSFDTTYSIVNSFFVTLGFKCMGRLFVPDVEVPEDLSDEVLQKAEMLGAAAATGKPFEV